MDWIVPALCFFLALVMLVAGFAVWNMGPPEVNLELHRARMGDNVEHRELLEDQLRDRQRKRKLLVGCLFVGSGVMVVTAYFSMLPAERRRRNR